MVANSFFAGITVGRNATAFQTSVAQISNSANHDRFATLPFPNSSAIPLAEHRRFEHHREISVQSETNYRQQPARFHFR
jgi:hypothetical protein